MSAAVVYAQLKAFDSTLQRAILIYPTRVYSIDVTINATIREFHKICTTFRKRCIKRATLFVSSVSWTQKYQVLNFRTNFLSLLLSIRGIPSRFLILIPNPVDIIISCIIIINNYYTRNYYYYYE